MRLISELPHDAQAEIATFRMYLIAKHKAGERRTFDHFRTVAPKPREGGEWVPSSLCSEAEITVARACGRFHLEPEGEMPLGWVFRPPLPETNIAAHSAAPWKAELAWRDLTGREGWTVRAADGSELIRKGPGLGAYASRKDAKVMAAAPDLLAAVVDLLAINSRSFKAGDEGFTAHVAQFHAIEDRAREAIARATGSEG